MNHPRGRTGAAPRAKPGRGRRLTAGLTFRVAAFVAVASGALASHVSCSAFGDSPTATPCDAIPKGGCPSPADTDGSPTTTCSDPTCNALYTCQPDGTWAFVAKCPHHVDAGPPDGGLACQGGSGHEVHDAAWDVPRGANGGTCQDLELPDCPLGLALSCYAGCCCGCQNLFTCDDGGWLPWGSCNDGGELVASPPPGSHDP